MKVIMGVELHFSNGTEQCLAPGQGNIRKNLSKSLKQPNTD